MKMLFFEGDPACLLHQIINADEEEPGTYGGP